MSKSAPDLSLLQGKSALVLGAGGFIGTHLTAMLKNHGANVIAVDRHDRAGFLKADVTDFKQMEQVFQNPINFVFHLAGQKSARLAKESPLETLKENFIGTLNLLDLSRQNPGIKKVILISSLAVYGVNENNNDKIGAVNPDSIYSAAKITGEIAGLAYFHDFKVPVTLARLANVYGPGQSELAFIPSLLAQMSDAAEVTLGNTETIRDFTYVEDVVRALCALAVNEKSSGLAFDIGSGIGTSTQTVAEKILSDLKFAGQLTVDSKKLRPFEKKTVIADTSLFQEIIGWNPSISLDDGLKRTILAINSGKKG